MQAALAKNSIEVAVGQARSRLGRAAGRALLAKRAGWLVVGAAVLGAARPILWPLEDDAPLWCGMVRALGLMAAGLVMGAAVLLLVGRRRRPSPLGAARAIDGALGLHEVVASGHVFGSERRPGPVVELARSRAQSAVASLDVARSFPLPLVRLTRPLAFRLAILAALAATIGSYDPVLAEVLISPPTSTESRATARLEEAARAIEKRTETRTRQGEKRGAIESRKARDAAGAKAQDLAKTAREAARAARRGDRSGALAKLDALRRAGEDRAGRSGRLDDALRRIAEALRPASASRSSGEARSASPRTSASQELRRLSRQMQSRSSSERESAERMLSRLSRAEDEARRASRESAASERAAEAIRRAAEALSRGDSEAASRALDEAAQRAEELEEARRQAEADAERIMRMLEASGALERAIQMAMLGREGQGETGQGMGMQEGQGEGEGGSPSAALGRAIAARLAAMGVTTPNGAPGTGDGGHVPDRGRARRKGLATHGALQARSQVREGQRAVLAIQGLGRGGEPTRAFREVFPAYDAVAEEGIQDESIPAARRAVVRRYFQAIRPGQ